MGARRSYSNPRTQLPSSSTSPMEANYITPIPELDDHTPFSGAYIRSLVKQLATSSSSSSASPPRKTHQKPHSNAPHKKQVRRRLHTTKPYQERLLNMAEARKEIVTALKFHRATMKQQQQQQQQQQSHPQPPPPPLEFTEAPVDLPSQTLGLNLSSFHDLTNLDAACLYSAAEVDVTSPVSEVTVASPSEPEQRQGVGPRALGDLEMEEIKYIGEMHEMEWNDTLNLANSAWWFKFLNNMETEEAVELPLYWEGNYGNLYQPRHLELPCMKIEDIEGMDQEWLS